MTTPKKPPARQSMAIPLMPAWTNDRIVAEVSKNWTAAGESPSGNTLLSQMFEHVIEVNRSKGYELESWELSRLFTVADGISGINETIIAVFKKALTGANP